MKFISGSSLRSVVFLLSWFGSACSSTPKATSDSMTAADAERFFEKYCSESSTASFLSHAVSGEVVVRSNTKDFKGQYPASIHVSSQLEFTMEITNLIGGTVGIIQGNTESMEVIASGKPKLNRKGVSNYLGIPSHFFVQLIQGGLPCPAQKKAILEGSEMVIRAAGQEWRYQQADREADSVPVRLRVVENGKTKVELMIEKWNRDENYAEKVKVQTQEGMLKWAWRSRVLEK